MYFAHPARASSFVVGCRSLLQGLRAACALVIMAQLDVRPEALEVYLVEPRAGE